MKSITPIIAALPTKTKFASVIELTGALVSFFLVDNWKPSMINSLRSIYTKAKPHLGEAAKHASASAKYQLRYFKAKTDEGRDDAADSAEDHTILYAKELRILLNKFQSEQSISSDQKSFLQAASTFLRTGSDSSEKAVTRLGLSVLPIGIVRDVFAESLVPTENTQSSHNSEIIKYVKSMNDDPKSKDLDPKTYDKIMELKKKSKTKKLTVPEQKLIDTYTKYLAAKRGHNSVVKDYVRQFVAQSGYKIVMYSDLIKYLTKNKIENNLPREFIGKIDMNGKYYTMRGKQLLSNPAGKVIMNDKYSPGTDNTYVLKTKAPLAKDWTKIYTISYREAKDVKKFKKVRETNVDKSRLLWLKDMYRGIKDDNSILATLMEFSYQGAARIGTVGNATKGKSTFGASTFERRHIKLRGNSLIIGFPSKSDGFNKFIISNTGDKASKSLYKNIRDAYDRSDDPNFIVLSDTNGNPFTNVRINQIMKSKYKMNATFKIFRTLKGTKIAQRLLSESPFDSKSLDEYNSKEVNEWFLTQMVKVGEALQHTRTDVSGKVSYTAATAIKSYIDQSIIKDFFLRLSVAPNASIGKAIGL